MTIQSLLITGEFILVLIGIIMLWIVDTKTKKLSRKTIRFCSLIFLVCCSLCFIGLLAFLSIM